MTVKSAKLTAVFHLMDVPHAAEENAPFIDHVSSLEHVPTAPNVAKTLKRGIAKFFEYVGELL